MREIPVDTRVSEMSSDGGDRTWRGRGAEGRRRIGSRATDGSVRVGDPPLHFSNASSERDRVDFRSIAFHSKYIDIVI